MEKPIIYLETSVISYLTSRPSRDGLAAARQAPTHDWWSSVDKASLSISDMVLQEITRGDPQAASRRLALVGGLHRIVAHAQTDLVPNPRGIALDGFMPYARFLDQIDTTA